MSPTAAPLLEEITDALHRLGLRHRVDALPLDDTDVRLVVLGRGRPYVELLVPVDPRAPGRWYAVRVDGERREVWRGPDRSDSLGPVVGFVDDLLTGRASRRWDRLG